MIYFLAIVLSLIVSVQSFASEIAASNIRHLQNGRLPNAGAAIFPTIPVVQFFAVGVGWLLEIAIPEYALWLLLSGFLILTTIWAISFAKLRGELALVAENAKHK